MKSLTSPSKFFLLFAIISLLNLGASTTRQTNTVIFAVIGDYGSAGQAEADVAQLVKSWNPDFIVTVGDNNYPNGAAYSIDQNIGQYYHEYIYKYNGKYGGGSNTRRFFPALGNHDWHNGSVNPHTNYFNLPGNERFYDFVYGSVHFFILDSIKDEPDGNTATSAQARWLQNRLAASTSQFNVVVTHYAPYSSGKHGPVPFMQWPFKEWGADVVLAGHDHHYERLLVNGMTYFVNGVGGDELYGFRSEILPESQARYNQNFGAMRVEATDASMKFQFFTRDNILIDEYVLGTSIPNVSSISSASSKQSNLNNLEFNITFSESVSGVDTSDFLLTTNLINGAYVSSVSGADSNYVVSVNTGIGDGDVRLDLINDGSIANIYGAKLGGIFSSEAYMIDKSAPIVNSITRINVSPTNAANVDFAVAFAEPVTGLDISDLMLTSAYGAMISNISGSGATYLVSINTGSADDSLRLDVLDNDSVIDSAGNSLNGNFTAGEVYAIDKTAPYIVSILRANLNPSSAAFVDFNVTFSEPVLNVDASDFILNTANINGAYIANINGSGYSYVVSVGTGNNSGDLRLDAANDFTITDVVANTLGNMFMGETYTMNKSAPTVLAISRINADLSNAVSVDFNIIFSEPVSGVDAADFILTTTGISGAYISSVSGADLNYVISVNTGTSDGTLRLDLLDDDSIINLAGNQLGTLGTGNGNFSSTEIYTIDKTLPVILSILRASPDPSNAASVDYIVNFSESVSGIDISDFILNTTSGAFISNINSSGLSYVVSITTGTGADALRLDFLSNGSVVDSAKNPAGQNFSAGEIYVVNKISPMVVSILRVNPNSINAVSADFIVNFSESVFGVDISDFILTTSGVSGASISSINGSGLSYGVLVKTGTGNGSIRLDLADNNSIVNFIGNALGGINLSDGSFMGEIYDVIKQTSPNIDITPPSAPVLLSPLNDARLSARFNFVWTKISDATRYHVEIDNNADFSSPEWSSWRRDPNYLVSSMRKGAYYWHVRAKDMAGNWSAWSTMFKLTVP